MAVEFTTMILMDMYRDEEIEELKNEEVGYINEVFEIWCYSLEIPCIEDEKKNEIFIQAMNEKFSKEEADYNIEIRGGKIYYGVVSTLTHDYGSIEDLYIASNMHVRYLREILEEHDIKECTLILQLYSSMEVCSYNKN